MNILFQEPKSPTELVTSPVVLPSADRQYSLTPFNAESSAIQLSGLSSSTQPESQRSQYPHRERISTAWCENDPGVITKNGFNISLLSIMCMYIGLFCPYKNSLPQSMLLLNSSLHACIQLAFYTCALDVYTRPESDNQISPRSEQVIGQALGCIFALFEEPKLNN